MDCQVFLFMLVSRMLGYVKTLALSQYFPVFIYLFYNVLLLLQRGNKILITLLIYKGIKVQRLSFQKCINLHKATNVQTQSLVSNSPVQANLHMFR